MKRILTAVAALAALAAPTALVLGQDAFKDQVDQAFEKMDANKDGKLSADEVKAKWKEREEELEKVYKESKGEDSWERVEKIYQKYEGVISFRDFLRADADDDMSATRDEMARYFARVYTKHAEGPPKLSDKDFDLLAREQIEEMWPKLMKFDADKDGKLSKEEAVKFAAEEMKESDKITEGAHPVEVTPPQPAKDGGKDG